MFEVVALHAQKMKDSAGSTIVATAANSATKENGGINSGSTSANSSLGESFRESGKILSLLLFKTQNAAYK